MKTWLFCLFLTCSFAVNLVRADDDYRVEPLAEAAPEDVAEPIAKLLSAEGLRVVKGESRTICDLWLCKEWNVQADFEPTAQVLYPFTPGQLVGVLRFPRKSADFRDQPIGKGVYTVRYMQQPVDGNHVGTSPTRDFFLLVLAEQDNMADVLAYRPLVTASAEAAESSHPAMLCLQKADEEVKRPAMLHNEDHDWRILQFVGNAKAGDKASPLPVDLVIEGISAE